MPGYRNNHRTSRLKTAEGPIGYAAPPGADNGDAPFRWALRERLQGRTEVLDDPAVEPFARGPSTRDIATVFGGPLLIRAAVSKLSEWLWAECQAFAGRDLAEHDILHLFVEGIAGRLQPRRRREPVLAA